MPIASPTAPERAAVTAEDAALKVPVSSRVVGCPQRSLSIRALRDRDRRVAPPNRREFCREQEADRYVARIVEMELWDLEDVDLVGPAFSIFIHTGDDSGFRAVRTA